MVTSCSFWRGRRVFLTGHTGFKGSWLSLWLEWLGASVTGYALEPPTSPSLHVLAGNSSGQHADIRDLATLHAAMQAANPEIVFHLAAQPLVRASYDDPVGTFDTNVMGTVNVLQALRGLPSIRAAVIVTSDKCYRIREDGAALTEFDPLGGDDPYSASKGCAEIVTQSYAKSFVKDVAIATARAGNVIGGGDFAVNRLVPDIMRAIESRESLTLRYPQAIRPWQHVLDPLAGYIILAERLHAGERRFADAWNFGPDESLERPVLDVVDGMKSLSGSRFDYRVESEGQPHEASRIALDSSRARHILQWQPRLDFADSLRWTYDWYRAVAADPAVARAQCLAQLDAYMALEPAPAKIAP